MALLRQCSGEAMIPLTINPSFDSHWCGGLGETGAHKFSGEEICDMNCDPWILVLPVPRQLHCPLTLPRG